MARRGDVMHYTLDLCKDRKARVSGIFGRRRRPLPCQRYGRARQGGRFWPNTDATPIIRWLSWASFHGVEPVTDPDTKRWLLLYDIYVRQAAQQPLNAPQTAGNVTFKM